MKKCSPLFAALLTLFIIISAFQHEASAQSKWSGSLTKTEKVVWEGGKSDSYVEVSFTNALPTLHRNDTITDLNFTDDKGTGTANSHSKRFIGGKLIGYGDCRGYGQTELHEVVIKPEDSSLTIHARGPTSNCLNVDVFPEEKTYPSGPVTDIDITVHSKAMGGVNQTVLTGAYTTVSDIAGLGKVTTTISWGLWRGPIDAVLIVSPVNYNNWMPIATSDELRKGNSIHVNLKVQKRNGGDSPFRVSRFELKLNSTSAEKGTTLNLPLDPSPNQLPDLRLLPDSIAESNEADQSLEINSMDGKTGYFSIGSYDGGGWTTLTAVAVLEGGIRIEGTLFNPTGIKEIPIPKRNANTKIATAWLTANGNPGEMDDKEKKTPNPNIGDGLTAYEEYRGVISKGEFTRLKATEKELGVMATKANHLLFAEGVRLFESASGLKVIRFDETEINPDRRLNKNFLTAHDYDQYVLKLENAGLTGNAMGVNEPESITQKIPRQSERVVIDISKISASYQAQATAARAGNIPMPYTQAEDLANTVAHELAHGIHIIHHGKSSAVPSRKAYTTSSPSYRIFWFDGTEETVRPYPSGANDFLENAGTTGNDSSGDLSCIMAYTNLYNWAFRTSTADGSLYYYKTPLLPVGKKLCTSETGTGINRPANVGVNGVNKYFGDAENGNCLNQIKLRD